MSELSEFNELKAELGDYIKKVEKDFYIAMAKKRAPYQEFLDRILTFYFVTSFISEKKIASVENGVYSIDLKGIGVNKLLGRGHPDNKYKVTVQLASKIAIDRIKKKGGDVLQQKK